MEGSSARTTSPPRSSAGGRATPPGNGSGLPSSTSPPPLSSLASAKSRYTKSIRRASLNPPYSLPRILFPHTREDDGTVLASSTTVPCLAAHSLSPYYYLNRPWTPCTSHLAFTPRAAATSSCASCQLAAPADFGRCAGKTYILRQTVCAGQARAKGGQRWQWVDSIVFV
jgi:hypothetical protein